jgi:type II secretory pathway component GspD/PulD (secretin)
MVALALSGPASWAQTAASAPKPATDAAAAKPSQAETQRTACDTSNFVQKTFYLTSVAQVSDANDILNTLRNALSYNCDRILLVPSRNAIVMSAIPDEIARAEKIIGELDRPRKSYRLTYSITEMDGATRVGSQKFAMVAADGQRTVMKQGSKVPLATGSYTSSNSTAQTQFTYLDVGMNFEVTATELGNGTTLKTHVEQSSVAEDKAIAGVQEPVIRQVSLEGMSFVLPGKPLVLGSMDIPGSTRHLDVEVVMEVVPEGAMALMRRVC